MSRSKFFPPSKQTESLVVTYLSIKTTEKSYNVEDKYIPDGYTAIVIHFTDSKRYIKSETEKYELPDRFFTIPFKKNLVFEASSDLETIIIICKTPAFSKIFKLRMDELPNRLFYQFNWVIDDEFYCRLKKETNLSNRIKVLEKFLIENYLANGYIEDEIDQVYDKIINGNTNQKIHELLSRIKMNQRSFRRQFLHRVGLSAKELLCLVRVNHVWDLYRQDPSINFNDLVYECSYFDQSHFIHDFKKIIGETPKEFFGRNLKQVETFSGKKFVRSKKI